LAKFTFLIKSVGETVRNALLLYESTETRLQFKEQVKDQVLLALQELHAHGYAHCDLHIDNVFVIGDWIFLDDLEYLTQIDDKPPEKNYHSIKLLSDMKAGDIDNLQYDAFVLDLIDL
jgi:RIO-like serine/threonine protein kinase